MKSVLAAALMCLCIPSPVFSQTPDAGVVIYQSTLNNFMTVIGPISGKDHYSAMGMNGDYSWTLKNPRIELIQDRAKFVADVDVSIGPVSYSSTAQGDADIQYHPETNKISVKVEHAIFELYIKVFGNKLHITDVDAAAFYKPKFEFVGPEPIQQSVQVSLPDGTIRTIFFKSTDPGLRIEPERLIVTSKLLLSDHPFGKK